ncbi:MAG: hypothetical protein O2874_05865, partial [Verrucomicrobia bacterium]|nr:hypothetical protein [Verrucomicrobiota bacterium]
ATVSGSTLTIQGAGNVTITARQPGNYAYRAAIPVPQSLFVKLVGRPLILIFDGVGTMDTNQSFKPRVTLKDGVTGKLIDRTKYTSLSVSFSVTNSVTGTTNATNSSGTINTGTSAGTFTVTASVSDSNSDTKKRYVPKTDTITVTVDSSSSKTGQTIKVHDGGSGSFGLRDLPLSRKPIMIGKMFEASSGEDITFTIANDAQKIVDQTNSVLSGTDAKIVFNEMSSDGGVDGKFKGFGSGDELSFDIVASQTGNDSYHAAQSVSRTVKIKKPSKKVFFEERKADPRYEDVKAKAMNRMPAGVSGEKALALFNSDNYDSDGDGVSNLLERAFGGDSLGNDSRSARPAPVKKNDNYEYLSFDRYNSDFQADMGLVYIVEESSDRRTWTSISSPLSTTDLGGGMERVVYRTTSTTSAGSTKFIRVRVKAK